MIALRQFKRVPNDHKIVIDVPDNLLEDQLLEVILLCKDAPKNDKLAKIEQLKNCQTDKLFLADLHAISDEFTNLDFETW